MENGQKKNEQHDQALIQGEENNWETGQAKSVEGVQMFLKCECDCDPRPADL